MLTTAPPAGPWSPHHVLISTAARVDLSHLGIHTHADFVRFDAGTLDVAAMQADKTAVQYRNLSLVAHCRLPTDRAALPPGLDSLQKSYGPIPTYGPIDGKPGWSVGSVFVRNGQTWVQFSAPSRFANWVAAQKPALRRRYKDPHSYSLEIRWEELPKA